MEVPNELAEYTAQVLQAEMVTAGKRFINVIDCPVDPKINDFWDH